MLPLRHGEAGRFFAIHILARPHGQDRGRGVPAVAGGNQHGIDVGPFGQQLAHVPVRRAILVAVFAVHGVLGAFAVAFPHIADGHKLHVGLAEHPAQIAGAAAADADGPHHDPLARRHRAVAPQRRGRE